MKNKNILILISVLLLGSCNPEPDPKPVSEAARASIEIKTDVLSLRSKLRTARDAASDPGQKLAIEVLMSVLASSVRICLDDLVSDHATDIAKIALVNAIEAELNVAKDKNIQDAAKVSIYGEVANLLDKMERVRKMIPVTQSDFTLSLDWQNFLKKEQDYAIAHQVAVNKLLDQTQTCAAGQATITGMLTVLSSAANLDDGYRNEISIDLNTGRVRFDVWAKLRATAIRMDAMNQLMRQSFTASPLSGCGYPPDVLNDAIGGVGGSGTVNSCVKITNGDEAGTSSSGSAGSGGGSSPCLMAASSAVVVPPPAP